MAGSSDFLPPSVSQAPAARCCHGTALKEWPWKVGYAWKWWTSKFESLHFFWEKRRVDDLMSGRVVWELRVFFFVSGVFNLIIGSVQTKPKQIARFKVRIDYTIRIHACCMLLLGGFCQFSPANHRFNNFRKGIDTVCVWCICTYYILILILRILPIHTHTHTFPSFLFTFHLSYHTVVLIPVAFNWWNRTALLRILGLYAALRVAACLWMCKPYTTQSEGKNWD